MRRTHKFKAGDIVPLDEVYEIIGIIPRDAYTQDDPYMQKISTRDTNDFGETLRFVRGVTIKIEIT